MTAQDDSQPIIELIKLIKTYGLLPVLRKIDLSIYRGEFVALLGPNGSGKSTTIRLLTGLTQPTAGEIRVGGWSVPKEMAAVRAQIGLVSHKSLLYENLTARENLRFFANLYNLPRQEINQRIDHILERVDLLKRGDDLIRTFSRGMQQRLSIARALLHDPHVLLFDEPYTGLDQSAAATLDGLLNDARQDKHTIIMATHQLNRAAELADRVVILNRGKVGYDETVSGMTPTALTTTYAEITGMATAR